MLSAQHLVKSFAGRRVIEDVTLQLERGEVVGLLGPNGAGKTTTFQMLTACWCPMPARSPGRSQCHRHAFLRPGAFRHRLSAAGAVRAARTDGGAEPDLVLEARWRASARKAEDGGTGPRSSAGEVRKSRVGNLSGGQRRRSEIAITLACEPSFAMLDEPFAGVDPHATDEIGKMIHYLRRSRHRRLDQRP
jgi:lipopolysaccharide export system ATP-binding protein